MMQHIYIEYAKLNGASILSEHSYFVASFVTKYFQWVGYNPT